MQQGFAASAFRWKRIERSKGPDQMIPAKYRIRVKMLVARPERAVDPPMARKPWLKFSLDREQVSQNPELLAWLKATAPEHMARKAASLEIPRMSSMGSQSAAAVATPKVLEPVAVRIMKPISMGTKIPGIWAATMLSARILAAPALLMKAARDPPKAVMNTYQFL